MLDKKKGQLFASNAEFMYANSFMCLCVLVSYFKIVCITLHK